MDLTESVIEVLINWLGIILRIWAKYHPPSGWADCFWIFVIWLCGTHYWCPASSGWVNCWWSLVIWPCYILLISYIIWTSIYCWLLPCTSTSCQNNWTGDSIMPRWLETWLVTFLRFCFNCYFVSLTFPWWGGDWGIWIKKIRSSICDRINYSVLIELMHQNIVIALMLLES